MGPAPLERNAMTTAGATRLRSLNFSHCCGALAPLRGLLCLLAFLAGSGAVLHAQAPVDHPTVVLVMGAPGDDEFGSDFAAQAQLWRKVGEQAEAKFVAIGTEPAAAATTDRDRLMQALADESREGLSPLWIVLAGHGTFDGKEAKFNLLGPDFSASELAEWLKPFKRPLVIVDTTSSSAPFLAKLAGPNRAVVTSTRSGFEQNYARFGKFFAEAIADPASDLDKDGEVSLLEAFLSAARRTTEFYKAEGRLTTEHALIDDNGDGLGTPADWFKGVRATKRARDGAALDGTRAQQFVLIRSAAERQLPPEVRARRDKLELQVAELRDAKAKMKEDDYYRELERLLRQLAALYEGT
jgi:hypothetical protein